MLQNKVGNILSQNCWEKLSYVVKINCSQNKYPQTKFFMIKTHMQKFCNEKLWSGWGRAGQTATVCHAVSHVKDSLGLSLL